MTLGGSGQPSVNQFLTAVNGPQPAPWTRERTGRETSEDLGTELSRLAANQGGQQINPKEVLFVDPTPDLVRYTQDK